MKRNCREFVPRMETLDAQWKHPFTCVVAGPSGSGKSTFVRHLMLSQEKNYRCSVRLHLYFHWHRCV